MAHIEDGQAGEEVFECFERGELVVGDVQVVEVFELGSFGQRYRLDRVVGEGECLVSARVPRAWADSR